MPQTGSGSSGGSAGAFDFGLGSSSAGAATLFSVAHDRSQDRRLPSLSTQALAEALVPTCHSISALVRVSSCIEPISCAEDKKADKSAEKPTQPTTAPSGGELFNFGSFSGAGSASGGGSNQFAFGLDSKDTKAGDGKEAKASPAAEKKTESKEAKPATGAGASTSAAPLFAFSLDGASGGNSSTVNLADSAPLAETAFSRCRLAAHFTAATGWRAAPS